MSFLPRYGGGDLIERPSPVKEKGRRKPGMRGSMVRGSVFERRMGGSMGEENVVVVFMAIYLNFHKISYDILLSIKQ